jgi:hypothetical protein
MSSLSEKSKSSTSANPANKQINTRSTMTRWSEGLFGKKGNNGKRNFSMSTWQNKSWLDPTSYTTYKGLKTAALAFNKTTHNAYLSTKGYKKNISNTNFNSINNLRNNKPNNLKNINHKSNLNQDLKSYVSTIKATLNDTSKCFGEIDSSLNTYYDKEKKFKNDTTLLKDIIKKIYTVRNTRYVDDYKKEVVNIVLKLKSDFKLMLNILKTVYDKVTEIIGSIYEDGKSSQLLLKKLKNLRTFIKQLLVLKTDSAKSLFDSLKKDSSYNYNLIKNKIKTSNNKYNSTKFNNLLKLSNTNNKQVTRFNLLKNKKI